MKYECPFCGLIEVREDVSATPVYCIACADRSNGSMKVRMTPKPDGG
jgi:hypothetical protein